MQQARTKNESRNSNHTGLIGQVILVFLVVHGILKFGIEFTRDPYHWMHQTVLPIALMAAIVLAVRWWQQEQVASVAVA